MLCHCECGRDATKDKVVGNVTYRMCDSCYASYGKYVEQAAELARKIIELGGAVK